MTWILPLSHAEPRPVDPRPTEREQNSAHLRRFGPPWSRAYQREAKRISRAKSGLRNGRGWRVGEWHGRAKYSDAVIRAMRADYQRGVRGHGLEAVAKRHGVPYETARDILRGVTRWSA